MGQVGGKIPDLFNDLYNTTLIPQPVWKLPEDLLKKLGKLIEIYCESTLTVLPVKLQEKAVRSDVLNNIPLICKILPVDVDDVPR